MVEVGLDFQQIHAEYRPKVQRYLARLVGETEAEDLTQEVFVKISQALPAFRGESKLSTWIYRIAKNAAYDRMRSPSFRRVTPDGLARESETDESCGGQEGVLIGQAALPPEQQVFKNQRLACYCEMIEDLPENYRTIVAFSELEELAAGEIAGLLGLSVAVVKIRLHRGRERLLRELKAHCSPEDWL